MIQDSRNGVAKKKNIARRLDVRAMQETGGRVRMTLNGVQAGEIVPARHVLLIRQLYSNGSHPTPLFFLLRDVSRGVTSARVLPDKKLLKLNAP